MNKIFIKINKKEILQKFIFGIFVSVLLVSAYPVHAASLFRAPSNLGLIGYWPLNDGSGTVATDASGNGVTGTLVNAPSWVSGKFNKALSFTSSSSQSVQINGLASKMQTGDATFSAWVKFNSTYTSGSAHMTVIRMADAPSSNDVNLAFGYPGNGATDGKLHMTAYTSSGFQDTASTSTSWQANRWYFIAGTYQDGVQGKLYVDGVLDTTGAGAGSRTTTYSVLASIGKADSRWDGDTTPLSYFDGSIDEVRAYNRVLSAAEISNLYTSGARKKNVPTNNGLVGYWPFNDGSGTVAGDASGNGSSGTLINGPSWIMGRIGKALSFISGNLQYVDLGTPSVLNLGSTNSYTLSAWVYPTSAPNNLSVITEMYNPTNTTVQYSLGFDQDSTSGTSHLVTGFYAAATWRSVHGISNVPLNTWTFIAGTWDGSRMEIYQNGVSVSWAFPGGSLPTTDFDKMVIGRRHDASGAINYFPGYIDDVRIYNRALSDPEIYSLYKNSLSGVTRKPPNNLGLIGYWPLNEGTGTSAGDASGNGNTGTLTNMASPATSTSGWGNGKFSKGLIFDGTNDYVNIANPTTFNFGTADWTVSAWVKRGVTNELVNIFTKSTAGAWAASGKQLYLADSSEGYKITFDAFGISGSSWKSNTAITDTNWHLATVSFVDSSNLLTFYLDGVADGTATAALTADSGSHILEIATDNGPAGGFSYLDEVRIYNRALSATDVFNLYNYGR